MNCNKCGRRLKNPSSSGFGPVCGRAMLGIKPRAATHHRITASADTSTPDLFAAELDVAVRFHEIVGGLSLEMA